MKAWRLAAAVLLLAPLAHAGAAQEAGARQALVRARAQHHLHHYSRALAILSAAETACEPDRCSPSVLAALLRDMGTMQLLDGEEEKARNNFSAALTFDSTIDLNPAYAVPDVRAVWESVKSPGNEQQPSGDFDHTPPAEQKNGIPLPLYVEYHGSAHPSSVVVRYQGPGMQSYRRVKMQRVGNGWGIVVPCGAVKIGTLHYYFQGFDSDELPILDGGDKRHPYFVPIRDSIEGRPPHLPGHRAPTMCGEGLEEVEEEHHEEGGTAPPVSVRPNEKAFARVWLGISGALDFTVLPSGTDVCTRNNDSTGTPTDSNWACTSDTPEGSDFPGSKTENASLVQGKAGDVTSGVQPGNVRVKLTFDYAITQNIIIGAAIGYVAGAYSGNVSPHFVPMHIEAHAAWLFGSAPLSHVGFAPYLQVAAGVGEYDANLTIMVTQNNVAGSRPVEAWHVGGPGFVALEAGVRFAFSQRVGFMMGLRGTLAFGTSIFPAFGPDMDLQVGF